MPHKLFVTTRQWVKIGNAIANNMSANIKLSKDQILYFSQRNVTVLQIMTNYQEARVKLTTIRLNKLKSAAKNKTGKISRLNKKNPENEELPHQLFLATRQKTNIRNAFKQM